MVRAGLKSPGGASRGPGPSGPGSSGSASGPGSSGSGPGAAPETAFEAADALSQEFGHRPVMLREAVEALRIKPDGFYVDATLGGGGHARAILGRLGPRGRLLGLDLDAEAIEFAGRWAAGDPRVSLRRLNFKDLASLLEREALGPADGLLADLGLSGRQLLDPARGFSFAGDGPLDMRLDRSGGDTAADLVNRLPEADLAKILKELGEEPSARRLAAAVVRERALAPVDTAGRLASVALGVLGPPGRPPRIHPATRTFMALRMAVNGELESLAGFLDGARRCLKTGGRLVVVSFHSLEDRLVKVTMRGAPAEPDAGPARPEDLKGPPPESPVWRRLRRKVVKPGEAEVAANPRARSAKLRAAEAI